MHVVIQVEAHPDRNIEAVYGPFADESSAQLTARARENANDNFTSDGFRLYHYWVMPVEAA